ncbi:MAG TPA: hypothetical protein VD931_14615 [Baekduia sp.]|nr:hypothetical protein [Baekduia sp.]
MSAGHDLDRARRALHALLAVAVLVSIVHYVDNVANFADYPDPTSGPAPSRGVIAASWFAFTAFAAAAVVLLARGRLAAAAGCLAVYSMSGLVGFGHYTVEGATDMPWWRQTHIVADIACGLAVLGFAVWLARRERAAASA